MDKNTLSNYGWIVIAVLVLSVMIALATPFGTYIKSGVESTTQGLFDTSEKAMNVVGMTAGDGSFESGSGETGTQTPTEPETPTKDPALNPSGTIPEGATYTKADGTVLNAGDSFPEIPQPLDAYRYGDYTYVYSATNYFEPYTEPFDTQFSNGNYNGWLVTIRQETKDGSYYGYMLKKSEYGTILESINGQPITNMEDTFCNCTSLTTAPAIPNSVTNMTCTFWNCTKLTTAPEIPNGVTDMEGTFSGCTKLTTAPEIPNGVTDMTYTFASCIALTTAPEIPNSVTDMSYTFASCIALTTAPAIPSSVTNMTYAFSGCTALTTAPAIPNSVTNMYGTFCNCTSLTTAPEIPNGVTDMTYTFASCTALTSKPIIPSSVTTPESYIFAGCTQFGY